MARSLNHPTSDVDPNPRKRIFPSSRRRDARHGERHLVLSWPVFTLAAVVVVPVAIAGIVAPKNIALLFGSAVDWAGRHFGAAYMVVATGALLLVLGLAVSRYGNVRLGSNDSRPEHSVFSWAAMLFAAGISTDIMFFAVAEPISQYLFPPIGQGETVEAAREAVAMTVFHYGVHGWGLYALLGMALAYFAYRRGAELSLRSTLRPVLGHYADGWIGHFADAAALIGGMFGIATSLGVGVVQLSAGLHVIFGLSSGFSTQTILLIVGIAVACLSALTEISRGIKFLCTANVLLAGVLLLYVLITGRTTMLIDALVGTVGDFLRLAPQWSLETYAWERPDAWLNAWTLFFWAWWITWAAFVGLFLARISRGRTIREFVIGTMTIPFSYVVVWVGIFGNSALDLVRAPSATGPTSVADRDPVVGKEFIDLVTKAPELGLFELLASRPLGSLAVVLAVVVGVLFYVTSADSGALVMAELSTKPTYEGDQSEPTPWLRIFWAVMTGALTLAMLLAGGIPVLQNATVVMALPFTLVIVMSAIGLLKELRQNECSSEAVSSG